MKNGLESKSKNGQKQSAHYIDQLMDYVDMLTLSTRTPTWLCAGLSLANLLVMRATIEAHHFFRGCSSILGALKTSPKN